MTAENCGHIQAIDTVKLNFLEAGSANLKRLLMIKHSPFRYFKTSPEVIGLAVMFYVRIPLSLRNMEDLLHERETIQPSANCANLEKIFSRYPA